MGAFQSTDINIHGQAIIRSLDPKEEDKVQTYDIDKILIGQYYLEFKGSDFPGNYASFDKISAIGITEDLIFVVYQQKTYKVSIHIKNHEEIRERDLINNLTKLKEQLKV